PPTNWSRREHGAALHRLQLVRTPLDSTCYECQQERKDSRSSAVTILPNTHTHLVTKGPFPDARTHTHTDTHTHTVTEDPFPNRVLQEEYKDMILGWYGEICGPRETIHQLSIPVL